MGEKISQNEAWIFDGQESSVCASCICVVLNDISTAHFLYNMTCLFSDGHFSSSIVIISITDSTWLNWLNNILNYINVSRHYRNVIESRL